MSRTKQSKGKCAYCGQENAKSGMIKHLSTCTKRQELIASVQRKSGAKETLFHLRVQDSWKKDFWLDLEMRGSATLNDLDRYLRGIWLECCGHLSRFSYGGWQSPDIGKKRRAAEVFEPGVELTHIYDFGTSSETLIKVVEMRGGKPTTARPIALMARNLPPEYPCIKCKRPATWLCWECLIEKDVWGALCDEHAETHAHDNYGEPSPLVNSPRVGMCGYTGPAEPPY
jgi:hypothetical protein